MITHIVWSKSSLDMDRVNVSGVLLNATNSSTEIAYDHPATVVHIRSVVVFVLCVLGIPGNLFVIAVYARQMTSPTRVYMFALAIADLTVLVCGILLTKFALYLLAVLVVVWLGHLAITFSIVLLAFVSFERFLAVLRPHKFNTRARRAKIALVVISIAAAIAATLLTVTRLFRYIQLFDMIVFAVTASNVSLMIICYALMAAAMARNAKRIHANVGLATTSTAHAATPGDVSTISKGVARISSYAVTIGAHNNRRTAPVAPVARVKKQDKQTKLYKGYLLLFIITVVFLATWLPMWLANSGLHVSMDLQRMYVLNSIVNPFIYSIVSVMFREDVRKFCRKMRCNQVRAFT